jgi:hypothetical protein
MATKPDLVIFAGPVIVKPAFKAIQWANPTSVVTVNGAGSTYFANLADSLRDGQGRILPSLLSRYARTTRDQVGHLALCSYSAGWGLLNKVFLVDADRAEVDACVLSDSAFGTGLHGHEAFAADAMDGERLMVGHSSNNSANAAMGIMKTGRSTWQEIIGAATAASGHSLSQTDVRPPMPAPSGGVWNAGKFFWLDYVKPGSADNQGNDFTHAEHHDLAANAWSAYLVPYFAGKSIGGFPWKPVLGVGVAATGVAVAAYTLMGRKH